MNEGVLLNLQTRFVTIECYKCKMIFAVSEKARQSWLDEGESFYCPSGHSQHYTISNIQKLETQVNQLKRDVDRKQKEKEWAEQDATNAKNRERAQKGAKTKLKKRIAAGCCPCCRRNFQNLQQHMKNQHPDFVKAEE